MNGNPQVSHGDIGQSVDPVEFIDGPHPDKPGGFLNKSGIVVEYLTVTGAGGRGAALELALDILRYQYHDPAVDGFEVTENPAEYGPQWAFTFICRA